MTITLNGTSVQVTGPLTAAQRLVLDYAAMDFGIWNAGRTTKLASAVPRMSNFEQLTLPMGESTITATTVGTLAELTVKANSRRA